MNHRKVLSQRNLPFSWEQNPARSKFYFRDFQALALQPSPSSTYHRGDSEFDVVSKIPPPPYRQQPRSIRNASAKEDDPFLMAYKECTKSVKNGSFVERGNKGAAAVSKKSPEPKLGCSFLRVLNGPSL
ncbi:hypothetical protein SDJN03_04718, partial [Cucurbita argyrosperma subsp. sororia]